MVEKPYKYKVRANLVETNFYKSLDKHESTLRWEKSPLIGNMVYIPEDISQYNRQVVFINSEVLIDFLHGRPYARDIYVKFRCTERIEFRQNRPWRTIFNANDRVSFDYIEEYRP